MPSETASFGELFMSFWLCNSIHKVSNSGTKLFIPISGDFDTM